MNGIRKLTSNISDYSRSISGENERVKLPVIEKMFKKLDELAFLEDNWDSYDGLKPSREAMLGAAQFAYDMLHEKTPEPCVFPVPNGNIQFEWSCLGIELEVEIFNRQLMVVSYENLETEEHFEDEISYDLTELQKIIHALTEKNETRNRINVVRH